MINTGNCGAVYGYLYFNIRVDFLLFRIIGRFAHPSGRAFYSVGLRLLACWDVVQIPPGAWMLICDSHSSRGVVPTAVCLECDREASIMMIPGTQRQPLLNWGPRVPVNLDGKRIASLFSLTSN